MRSVHRILSALSVFALLAAPSALAGSKLSLVATGTLPMDQITPTESRFGFGGGGLLLEFGSPRVGFELGALYNRITVAVLNVSNTDSSVVVPGLLRFHLGSAISVGAGGYFGYALDDGDENDYGLQGALGARIPLSKGRSSFILEGRYNYGLKDLGGGVEARGITALVGLSFALGK